MESLNYSNTRPFPDLPEPALRALEEILDVQNELLSRMQYITEAEGSVNSLLSLETDRIITHEHQEGPRIILQLIDTSKLPSEITLSTIEELRGALGRTKLIDKEHIRIQQNHEGWNYDPIPTTFDIERTAQHIPLFLRNPPPFTIEARNLDPSRPIPRESVDSYPGMPGSYESIQKDGVITLICPRVLLPDIKLELPDPRGQTLEELLKRFKERMDEATRRRGTEL